MSEGWLVWVYSTTKRSLTVCAKLGKFARSFILGPGSFLVGQGYRAQSKASGREGTFTSRPELYVYNPFLLIPSNQDNKKKI